MKRAREKVDMLAADAGRKVAGVVTDGGISSGELEISAIVNVTYRLN